MSADNEAATVELVEAVVAREWHWTEGQLLLDAVRAALDSPPGDPSMRAFVAGWFAHARNPECLVVEDAWRAYRTRVSPPGSGVDR